METINLKEVTLLVTHYNRCKSLARLLATFAMQGIVFGDTVVSDDGSKPEQIEYLKQIQKKYPFRLVGTAKNAGLGNNINKGQKAVNTSFTLYVQEDFVPFELLKDLPVGMNSHAIFSALDPNVPVSLSALIHQDIIRGRLGFDGLMLSDDICMKALAGTPAELACRVLYAGADIALHCNGDIDEMKQIADVLPPMTPESLTRWVYALSMLGCPDINYDASRDMADLDVLLGGFAYDEKSIG